jgi:hypothetical protein
LHSPAIWAQLESIDVVQTGLETEGNAEMHTETADLLH